MGGDGLTGEKRADKWVVTGEKREKRVASGWQVGGGRKHRTPT